MRAASGRALVSDRAGSRLGHSATITYRDTAGHPSRMLFWYQAGSTSAPDRWGWYGEVLQARLRGKNPTWRLVEVATRQLGDEQDDLARLNQFVQAMVE